MKTHTETEKELSFTEELSMISPKSDFAIFIFTFIGIVIGVVFGTRMGPLLIGGYDVGGILICLVCSIIGFRCGMLAKLFLDNCN